MSRNCWFVCLYEGSLPPDADMYYGFTRFAIELNEIDSDEVHLYPATDTRFRPDQRYFNVPQLAAVALLVTAAV